MTGLLGLELAVGSKLRGIPLNGLNTMQRKPLPKREARGPLFACRLAPLWALVYPIPLHVCATIIEIVILQNSLIVAKWRSLF